MNTPKTEHRTETLPQPALLALGAGLTFAAHMQHGIGILGWIAVVPWLLYLARAPRWRTRAWLVPVALLAWMAASAKIITEPIPPVMALAVGGVLGIFAVVPFLIWVALRRGLPFSLRPVVFAASVVVFEWLQANTSPLASWGALAYTQTSNLPLLQVASWVGMYGVSFVVAWVGAVLAELWLARSMSRRRRVRLLVVMVLVLGVIHGAGALRMVRGGAATERAVVATIDTTYADTSGKTPSLSARSAFLATLLDDTAQAFDMGAELAVWTEAAVVFASDEEAAVAISRVQALADRRGRSIVMGYVVALGPDAPFKYRNEAVWLSPGAKAPALTHVKHYPAPGEPVEASREPLGSASWGDGVKAGVAICYDYDHPQLALEHGRLGVDMVAVPASDWRGIDPVHARMALVRSVENGASLVRSTRFGGSIVADPFGRTLMTRSSFTAQGRIATAEIPLKGQDTLYIVLGDLPVVLCGLFLLLLAVVSKMGIGGAGRFAR